jgi:dipeptidyl aminopeptidase/acylaminoacyl peptidase
MKKLLTGAAVVSLCALGTPVYAETAEEIASVFGARESVLHVSLSPSGDKLAYVAPFGTHGEALYTVDLAAGTPPRRSLVSDEVSSDLTSCQWVTDERLICRIYMTTRDAALGEFLGGTRLIALDHDGQNAKSIEAPRNLRALRGVWNGGSIVSLNSDASESSILMTREYVKEESLNTRLANSEGGLGVIARDVVSGREKPVEGPDKNARFYLADDEGRIRIKATQNYNPSGYLDDVVAYFYRTADSDRWQPLSRVEVGRGYTNGFRPQAVDAASNLAYGYDVDESGHYALYTVSLDGNATRTRVFSVSDFDVDDVVTLGRRGRVIGASYATEKRYIRYFDPAMKGLASALTEALPGNPAIDIAGASSDESELLVIAASDTDPGMLYLFDQNAKALNPLLPIREETVGRTLAAMEPVTYTTSDGIQVPAYLTLPPGSDGKNLAAIVMPHGGPSARDEWGFDWLVQFFAARGYAVLQPNFRGSAGYGANWFGENGFQNWRTAVGDVNAAGRWLVDQGIAAGDRLSTLGWASGGDAELQSQVLDPQLFKAVVAIAPVTDLRELREDDRNFSSYRLVEKELGDGPHLVEGSPAQNVGRFSAPVLIVHGDADQNVNVEQGRRMSEALQGANKNVDYLEFHDLAHDLDDSAARKQMLLKIDSFLKANLGS